VCYLFEEGLAHGDGVADRLHAELLDEVREVKEHPIDRLRAREAALACAPVVPAHTEC
jgi:hypothetical protein